MVTGFAILTLVFAYIAINTPERHGPLQIGHYILIHVMALFTAYVGFTEADAGESTANLLGAFVGSYSYIVYMVGAYFFIYILVQAFKFYKGDS